MSRPSLVRLAQSIENQMVEELPSFHGLLYSDDFFEALRKTEKLLTSRASAAYSYVASARQMILDDKDGEARTRIKRLIDDGFFPLPHAMRAHRGGDRSSAMNQQAMFERELMARAIAAYLPYA